MLLMALREGSAKCSNICPYYADGGVVRGCYDVPLATHCRATMKEVIVDCDVFDPRKTETMVVSEDEWKAMQETVRKHAKKLKKEYPEEHEEIHPVGFKPQHSESQDPKGIWYAQKSKNARIVADRRTMDGRKK